MASAAEDVHGVGQQLGDGVERFHRAFWAARQIDDQRLRAHAGGGARKRGARIQPPAHFAHLLTEAREDALAHGGGGFRRDVARADARAAGSQNQVRDSRVGQFNQSRLDD